MDLGALVEIVNNAQFMLRLAWVPTVSEANVVEHEPFSLPGPDDWSRTTMIRARGKGLRGYGVKGLKCG